MLVESPAPALEPTPYHVELRDYLKTHERDLWNWFASARAQADYTGNLRLDLLKSTYRLDAGSHPELFQSVEQTKAGLKLDIPVTLYQARNNPQLNASLFYMPGEGHIVFSGPVLTLLNADEIRSVIGHELAHYHLWSGNNGDFHIADRLIQAVANDPRASASHQQTARLFRLHTEIFADRGSLCATGDLHAVVAGLVKMETGLTQVSAAGYLKQAEEIFAGEQVSAGGISHPETFIRARALALWQEKKADMAARISDMIEGAAELDELDLIGQLRLTSDTRRLLECLLRPKWAQTPAMLGHARQFFTDFQPVGDDDGIGLDRLNIEDARIREYFCYVLLDFVRIDPELDQMPLVAALQLGRQLELDAQFEKLAAKELKMKVRDLRKLKEQSSDILSKAEVKNEP